MKIEANISTIKITIQPDTIFEMDWGQLAQLDRAFKALKEIQNTITFSAISIDIPEGA